MVDILVLTACYLPVAIICTGLVIFACQKVWGADVKKVP